NNGRAMNTFLSKEKYWEYISIELLYTNSFVFLVDIGVHHAGETAPRLKHPIHARPLVAFIWKCAVGASNSVPPLMQCRLRRDIKNTIKTNFTTKYKEGLNILKLIVMNFNLL
ncbi:hypothetical protein ACJX0J_035136, partial [Zea mays]